MDYMSMNYMFMSTHEMVYSDIIYLLLSRDSVFSESSIHIKEHLQ